MINIQQLLVAISLASSLSSAAPAIGEPVATIPISKRSARVGLIPFSEMEDAVIGDYAAVYAKYNQTTTYVRQAHNINVPAMQPYARFAKKITKRQNEALTMAQGGSLWSGNIKIGTNPGSTVTVDFDTGSADLWVDGVNCTTTACSKFCYNTLNCISHSKYDDKTSTTDTVIKNSTTGFKITYADGSTTSGPVFTDTVTIAGLAVAKQYFSPVTSMSSFISDGILGMGFPRLSSLGQNPFFQNWIAGNPRANRYFSFFLSASGSNLYIGGADSTKFTGTVEYHKVTQQIWWTIAGPQVNVGGIAANNAQYNAIIDTGTTLLYGPTVAVNALMAAFNKTPFAAKYGLAQQYTSMAGFWTIPCQYGNLASQMPAFGFQFEGGRNITIDTDALLFACADNLCNRCLLSIAGNSPVGSNWLIGDAFLVNTYSIFNVGTLGTSYVGFAQLKNPVNYK